MSGMGDLAVTLSIDTSDFVAPLNEAADVTEKASSRVALAIESQGNSWVSMAAHAIPSVIDLGVLASNAFGGMETVALACIPALMDAANAAVYTGIAVSQGIGGTVGLAAGATIAGIGVSAIGTTAALMTQPAAWVMAGQAARTYGASALSAMVSSGGSLRTYGAQVMKTPQIAKLALSMTAKEWELLRTKSTISMAQQALSVAKQTPAALQMGKSYAAGALVAVGGLTSVSNILMSVFKANLKVQVQGDSMWADMANGVLRYGSIASTVAGFLFPPWKVATVAINTAIFGVKLALTDTGKAAFKLVAINSGIVDSFQTLKASGRALLESLIGPINNATSTMSSLSDIGIYLITNWTPIPALAKGIGQAFAFGMDVASSGIKATATGITEVTDNLTAMALAAHDAIFNGNWNAGTEAYYAEAAALREVAKESERVMALQESRGKMFKQYGNMQSDAQAAAGRAEEVAAVNTAKTGEEIEALRKKYQQLFAAQINALQQGETLSAGTLAHMQNMTTAIENQAAAISSGRVSEKDPKEKTEKKETEQESPAARQYKQMAEELNKLTYGQEQAARMAIMQSDATDEEVVALLEKHDAIAKLQAQQEQQKHTDQLFKQGAQQIESMKDQVDLLSGAATEAQIKMRQMAREGFSQEQIEQVGELQDKLDQLKKDKNEKPKKEQDNKTSFEGSSDAAKLVLRGVGGGGNKMENIATKQAKTLEVIAANTAKQPVRNTQNLVPGIIA